MEFGESGRDRGDVSEELHGFGRGVVEATGDEDEGSTLNLLKLLNKV